MIFGKDSGGGAGTGEIQLNCSLAVLEWAGQVNKQEDRHVEGSKRK
jgi:hypothetical protein